MIRNYEGADEGQSSFKGAKNDLIAELKLSHSVGGISKLKAEQQKIQEQQQQEQYQKFLARFTMENFLEKIPKMDPNGLEIPQWKRETMAKKAAEKAKMEAVELRERHQQMKKSVEIPEWKRILMEKRAEDPQSTLIRSRTSPPKTEQLVQSFVERVKQKSNQTSSATNPSIAVTNTQRPMAPQPAVRRSHKKSTDSKTSLDSGEFQFVEVNRGNDKEEFHVVFNPRRSAFSQPGSASSTLSRPTTKAQQPLRSQTLDRRPERKKPGLMVQMCTFQESTTNYDRLNH